MNGSHVVERVISVVVGQDDRGGERGREAATEFVDWAFEWVGEIDQWKSFSIYRLNFY